MDYLRKLREKLGELHKLSKFSVKLGAVLMVAAYVGGAIARLAAPYAADYHTVMAIHRGCLEIAPALLAVGVCAGFIGDLMIRDRT